MSKRPILVTGSHRSGTTWVGRVIAAAPKIGYIHEPFNPEHPPGVTSVRFRHWFAYVTDESADAEELARRLGQTLGYRYRYLTELRTARSRRALRHLLVEGGRYARHRAARARPLVKDPIALLSSEWLADTFGFDVVVLIRHPAAFASSLRQLGWRFPFSHLLEQPALMHDLLAPFEREIAEFARHEPDILEQAALVWRALHHAIDVFRSRRPDWQFLKNEELSVDPFGTFPRVFARLDVPYTPKVEQMLQRTTQAPFADRDPHDPKTLERDSTANARNWTKRLSRDEITRLRGQVEDVSTRFYSDDDW